MSEPTKRHDGECDHRCGRDRGPWFEALALIAVSALAALVAGAVDASLWPTALAAGGAMALIHAAAGLWLQRELRKSDAPAVPFIWLKVGGVRFLAVPAIGLTLILIFGADPVASLAPPLAVYFVGLVIDTTLTRRRIFSDAAASPRAHSQANVAAPISQSHAADSVRMMEAST